MPLIQSDTSLYTFQDVVEHLLDFHCIDRDPMNQRNARRAVLNVYRDLPNRHCWSYYTRQRILQTVAPQSTGTISYDHTGGTHERQVTLTGATWPAWARFGRIIIDGVHYEVEDQKSSTVLTLEPDSNPGADTAAGISYCLYRNSYPLPPDFVNLEQLWDVDQELQLRVVDARHQHNALITYEKTPSTPFYATIRGDADYYGSLGIVFSAPPSDIRTYDMLYRAAPRRLKIDQYLAGSVSVSGVAVTGTGTNFPEDCVGSVIRFSANAQPPTGIVGGLADTDNRFIAQGIIKARTSGTALELEEPLTVSVGGGFVISDPIDVEPGAMMTAFLRLCEAELMMFTARKGWEDRQAMAMRELRLAMEADNRYPAPAQPPVFDRFRRTHITDSP
jgi:hypothetical protein